MLENKYNVLSIIHVKLVNLFHIALISDMCRSVTFS